MIYLRYMDESENMELTPRQNWIELTAPYRRQIEELQEKLGYLDRTYSGLKDLDLQFALIHAELNLVSVLVKLEGFSSTLEMKQAARECALDALDRIEEITAEVISLDQKTSILQAPELKEARSLLKEITLFGGAELFQAPDSLGRRSKRIVKSVERALYKFVTPAGHENSEIEEGDEEVYISDFLLLPRSQAVLMIYEEMIPQCESGLAENPGNLELQNRLEALHEQAEYLEKLQFFPRAMPFLPHESLGAASDNFIQFAADGDMLVKMKLRTLLGSGNKFDLLLENMKFQIVRDITGRSLGPEAGKPAVPTGRLFRDLTRHFPFLRRLEGKESLKKLVHLVRTGKREQLHRELQNMMVRDRNLLWAGETPELE